MDNFIAGEADFTFSRLFGDVICRGYLSGDKRWLLEKIAITNYIEPILKKHGDPEDVEASRPAFEDRVKSLRPKVILCLVGSNSKAEQYAKHVKDVAGKLKIEYVRSHHPQGANSYTKLQELIDKWTEALNHCETSEVRRAAPVDLGSHL